MDKIVREARRACEIKVAVMAIELNMSAGNYHNMEGGKMRTSKTPFIEKRAIIYLQDEIKAKIKKQEDKLLKEKAHLDYLNDLSNRLQSYPTK